MELSSFIIFFAIVIAVMVYMFTLRPFRRDGTQPRTSAGLKPRPSLVSNRPQRRRRNSGGYYPIGYDGPYDDGEDLIDYLVWFAIMDAMSDDELADLGEYGEYEEVEETIVEIVDINEETEELDAVFEEPEATSFEPIEEETRYGGGWGADSDSDGGWDDD